jgi:hypothetical protein
MVRADGVLPEKWVRFSAKKQAKKEKPGCWSGSKNRGNTSVIRAVRHVVPARWGRYVDIER